MTSLFVAWYANDPPVWGPVGRQDCEPGLAAGVGLYRFQYTRGVRSLAGFEPFDGMNDLEQIYEPGELFPLFKNRMLPVGRSDFRDYLTWSGFNPDDLPEPLVILGRTDGRKQTGDAKIAYGFVRNIRDGLPNASFIGFTGTPIELRDANTRAVFGHYVSVHAIRRTVADKATLLIDYESRVIKLVLEQAIVVCHVWA